MHNGLEYEIKKVHITFNQNYIEFHYFCFLADD